MEKFDKDFIDMIEDTLLTQLPDILRYSLDSANEVGKLRGLLELLYLDRLLPQVQSNVSKALPNGRILVFSSRNVKVKDLLGVAKSLGVTNEIEFYDYEQSKTYPYSKLEYNTLINAVLLGAVPHSTSGTDGYSSLVVSLERKAEEGVLYARVIRLSANNELKLTKESFREALKKLISEGNIRAHN